MTQRVYNFSAGPAMLPLPVLEEAQRDLVALPGVGSSVLEISHRSKTFTEIIQKAEGNLRQLLAIPEDYHVLFLQGGAQMQFAMVPMNLLRGTRKTADYVLTGTWSKKALKEARTQGGVRVAWDGQQTEYRRVPEAEQLELRSDAAYVHITSNETIQGVQFPSEPEVGEVPLVCDASSDFLSRPVPIRKYGLLYACAQKNAGPAGVTIVIVRDDLLQRCGDDLPSMLNYRVLAENNSLLNTPPVFAVYIVKLVTDWLLNEIGGLEKMDEINRRKARLLYEAIDRCGGFYEGHAEPSSRSVMNVTFRLPNSELEQRFLQGAAARDLVSLKGHRSVGGFRASIYNAMPMEGVQRLRDFMLEFYEAHKG
ncbi:MAG TPA: 3-phosphoserine/phosphohydroxythreonine transaminase [Planctomycetaceae bacterium]|nr:3-phosphoserine/phosphohydroxythreonine transaminase [Planctomycetaceae bacterium]